MGAFAVDSLRASDGVERMPWTGKSFAAKHNHSLNKGEAKSAARQATAMVNAGVDEGVAIATANKRINRLRKKGSISDRARNMMPKKWGKDDDGIVAPTT